MSSSYLATCCWGEVSYVDAEVATATCNPPIIFCNGDSQTTLQVYVYRYALQLDTAGGQPECPADAYEKSYCFRMTIHVDGMPDNVDLAEYFTFDYPKGIQSQIPLTQSVTIDTGQTIKKVTVFQDGGSVPLDMFHTTAYSYSIRMTLNATGKSVLTGKKLGFTVWHHNSPGMGSLVDLSVVDHDLCLVKDPSSAWEAYVPQKEKDRHFINIVAPSFFANPSSDIPGLSVIPSGTSEPLEKIIKSFYARYPNDFDFLVVYPTELLDIQHPDVPPGQVGGFHITVRRSILGLSPKYRLQSYKTVVSPVDGKLDLDQIITGDAFYDSTKYFLSSGTPETKLMGRLQGVCVVNQPLTSYQITDPAVNATLLHEIMHQWGVYCKYDDLDFAKDTLSHWDCNNLENRTDMISNVNGMLSSGFYLGYATWDYKNPLRYADIELYLAGLRDIDDVGDIEYHFNFLTDTFWDNFKYLGLGGFFTKITTSNDGSVNKSYGDNWDAFINNFDDDNFLNDYTDRSRQVSFTINDLASSDEQGPRYPSYSRGNSANTQRDFKMAILLVSSEKLEPWEATRYSKFAESFGEVFHTATDGVATMDTLIHQDKRADYPPKIGYVRVNGVEQQHILKAYYPNDEMRYNWYGCVPQAPVTPLEIVIMARDCDDFLEASDFNALNLTPIDVPHGATYQYDIAYPDGIPHKVFRITWNVANVPSPGIHKMAFMVQDSENLHDLVVVELIMPTPAPAPTAFAKDTPVFTQFNSWGLPVMQQPMMMQAIQPWGQPILPALQSWGQIVQPWVQQPVMQQPMIMQAIQPWGQPIAPRPSFLPFFPF
ncbi:MAG: hypothetical protein V1753_05420 [Pseudomonadota bacterium]